MSQMNAIIQYRSDEDDSSLQYVVVTLVGRKGRNLSVTSESVSTLTVEFVKDVVVSAIGRVVVDRLGVADDNAIFDTRLLKPLYAAFPEFSMPQLSALPSSEEYVKIASWGVAS